MTFPMLHIPVLGDGMAIALDAVLHVFISHGLAIGLVSMIVLFQTLAALGKGAFWEHLGRSLLGPTVVVTTSIGAVTGVGIWFITGTLAPEGIGSLIHLFFWPWFIEWGAFTAEVVFLLIYYFLWERLAATRPRLLMAMGWFYVGMAVLSAILISGILGFMLTPDGWPWGQGFGQAYFNPTFVPQCFLRVAGGLALGSLLALGRVVWKFAGTPRERGRAMRLCGAILFGATAVATVSGLIYFSRVPQTYLTHWKFAVATGAWAQHPALLPVLNGLAGLGIVLTALAALLHRPALCRVLGIPTLILCLGLVTEFERVREFVRGPYLLPGYMYANQIPLAETAALQARQQGLLPRLPWINGQPGQPPAAVAGRALFDANCGVCHTIGGINDITTRIAGRTLEGVNAITSITQGLAPFMTPFSGTEEERLTMAAYLYGLANKDARRLPRLLKEN
jgi:mono/diheme cytochrome c family protein